MIMLPPFCRIVEALSAGLEIGLAEVRESAGEP